jgi:uncharacterized protein
MEWENVYLFYAFIAFLAGALDAIVGGGGLLQFPALLISLPNTSLSVILGTNKISGFSGTFVAAISYSKRVKFNLKLIGVISIFTISGAYIGANLVDDIPATIFKPVIFVLLILIAIYTFFKKDFGTIQVKLVVLKKQYIYGSILGLLIGFYDGLIGPGTGSFLVLGCITLLGFQFLEASAYAKVINCFSNLSALFVFLSAGNYILIIAIIMAVFNILGSILGTKLALKNGNKFIKKVFLLVVCLMIIRFGYEIFIK